MTKDDNLFDLSALDTITACNKPAEIEIKHPTTGAKTGVFVSIIGKDSDVYRGRVRAMADQTMRLAAIGKPNPNDASLDKAEAKSLEALVAATTGWRTEEPVRNEAGEVTGQKSSAVIKLSGERLDFNNENALRVYRAILPVREQVQAGVNDLGNFMNG